MKRLLALLLFVPSLCLAQVPDYVPLEGLVAWYPLNGNANDESGNGNDGDLIGNLEFTEDRNGVSNAAINFSGDGAYVNLNWIEDLHPASGELKKSISIWFSMNGGYWNPRLFQWGCGGSNNDLYIYTFGTSNEQREMIIDGVGVVTVLGQTWNHLVVTWDFTGGGLSKAYLNGVQLAEAENILTENWLISGDINIGRHPCPAYDSWGGLVDDIGFWERILTAEEVNSLFTTSFMSGCTDPTACNFDSDATSDNGSCIPSGCMETDACNYNALAECDGEECDYTCCPGPGCCGEGTVWDPVNELCIIAIPADLNYDGCVTVNDLLVLLAVHGTCPPYPEWPDEPTDSSDCPPGAIDQLQQDLNGEGWAWLGEYNTAQYFISTNPISWDNAQSLAVAYGGHLVVIESQDENDWISTSVGDEYVWIGLYQDTSSAEYSEPAGGWAWVNGAEVTYSNWAGNAPNEVNGLENACQMYSNGLWNDAPGNYFLDGSDGRDIYAVIEFSSACPTPDWSCGDPVTYWDYDYATVLIGDQCWFAENLRTESYADGTEIPEVTDNGDWSDLSTGAHCSYDNDSSNVAVYGLLYNWFTVQDIRGLCPSGWHVPTDGEWTDLENHIGSQGFSGNEGTAMKSTTGWGGDGNGTDDFGVSALPGGRRDWSGPFLDASLFGYWWSSSPNGPQAWNRELYFDYPMVERFFLPSRYGISVRCIKD